MKIIYCPLTDMNTAHTPQDPEREVTEEVTQEEVLEAMFSNLVVQQTRTALFALGQIEDPQTGQRILDLETAQMLIATLEMLKEKTRGNLSLKEDKLITQSIEQLHDIFEQTIRAIEKTQAEKGSLTESGLYTPPTGIVTSPEGLSTMEEAGIQPSELQQESDAQPEEAPAAPIEPAPPEESRKKFSKKY